METGNEAMFVALPIWHTSMWYQYSHTHTPISMHAWGLLGNKCSSTVMVVTCVCVCVCVCVYTHVVCTWNVAACAAVTITVKDCSLACKPPKAASRLYSCIVTCDIILHTGYM